MKEYIRKVYYPTEAESNLNRLSELGWEVISIKEKHDSFVYVWLEREKPKEPALLQEALTSTHH